MIYADKHPNFNKENALVMGTQKLREGSLTTVDNCCAGLRLRVSAPIHSPQLVESLELGTRRIDGGGADPRGPVQ